jgi:flavin reductase (DIM6/NTAB) family NADH-FMN oxidoreductase RutF
MNSDAYRALMRQQAGAVTIVAAGEPGARAGLTATAFSSLSDVPPTVLVCVQHRSGTHARIVEARAFSVNILARDQQAVAERFSGKTGLKGEDRFTGLSWSRLMTGAPILDGALAVLDCEITETLSASTHSVFIGRVVDGRLRDGGDPLVYVRGHYCGVDSA